MQRKVPLESAILDGTKETTKWYKVEERTKNECFRPAFAFRHVCAAYTCGRLLERLGPVRLIAAACLRLRLAWRWWYCRRSRSENPAVARVARAIAARLWSGWNKKARRSLSGPSQRKP